MSKLEYIKVNSNVKIIRGFENAKCCASYYNKIEGYASKSKHYDDNNNGWVITLIK